MTTTKKLKTVSLTVGNEQWKDIKGYEGHYQISDKGRVRSLTREITLENGRSRKVYGKLLKLENVNKNKRGQYYKRVTLTLDGVITRHMVHRLVLENFKTNPLNKPCANHIDGNPSNNTKENLEWVTHSENEKHSYRVLGKINGQRKLTIEEADKLRKKAVRSDRGKSNGNIKEMVEEFGISKTAIYLILDGVHYNRYTTQ